MKIALKQMGDSSWTGGITYMENLCYAVRRYAGKEVRLELVADMISNGNADPPYLKWIDTVAHEPSVSSYALRKFHSRVFRKTGYNLSMEKYFKGSGVDVFFSVCNQLRSKKATLAWIPDFQHLHLPQMFNEEERAYRNWSYRNAAERSTLVIVSSEDAKKDLRLFAPDAENKCRVLHFVPHLPDFVWNRNDSASVIRKYNIPESYVYLPNQFWKHKNHVAVIKALYRLRKGREKICVVSSGASHDYRNPGHFAEIMNELSRCGIRESFIYLGMVPREDFYALMRCAKFVLNPSLFEGWGTTVEESKVLGQYLLLSDLPVHREQTVGYIGVEYFEPENCEDLAEKLLLLWNIPHGPHNEREAAAQKELDRRIFDFGRQFMKIAEEAVTFRN